MNKFEIIQYREDAANTSYMGANYTWSKYGMESTVLFPMLVLLTIKKTDSRDLFDTLSKLEPESALLKVLAAQEESTLVDCKCGLLEVDSYPGIHILF